MSDIEFDPSKFVDRHEERAVFRKMLARQLPTRVLAIGDESNKGKTHLMRALQNICIENDVPVAFASPSELSEPHPVDLAHKLLRQWPQDIAFPGFLGMDLARSSGDWDSIVNSGHLPPPAHNSVNLGGANFENANQPMVATNLTANFGEHHHAAPSRQQLLPAQDRYARMVCMMAFAEDLRAAVADRVLVFILDGYEGYHAETKDWVEGFLKDHLIAHAEGPPSGLVIAMAGQSLPPFKLWKRDKVKAMVDVRRLENWGVEEVAEALECFGVEHEPKEVDFLFKFLRDRPPKEVVGMIQIAADEQRAST